MRTGGTGWSGVVFALVAALVVVTGPALRPAPARAAGPDDPTFNVQTGGIRVNNTSTIAPQPAGAQFTAQSITGAAASGTCTTTGTNPCQISVNAPGAARQWAVRQTAPPTTPVTTPTGQSLGWFLNDHLSTGSGGAMVLQRPYQFRTPSIANAATVTVPGTGTFNADSTSTATPGVPVQTFSSQMAASVDDPPAQDVCGLRIAMVLDQSSSMTMARQTLLRNSALTAINALEGTPSVLSLYTFGTTVAPTGQSLLQPTNTAAGIANLRSFVNALPPQAPGGQFTNYDQGLAQVLGPGNDYNLVIFMTDGAPTASRLQQPPAAGVLSRFSEIEQGIFTANEIKAEGTRIVGIGLDMDQSGGIDNLRAVSGPFQNQDYFDGNDEDFEEHITQAAAGACLNRLTIRKQVQDAAGNLITDPDPEDTNGWQFSNSITGAANTVDSPVTTAAVNHENGYAEAAVSIAAGATPTVTVTETPRAGYAFVGAQCAVGGANVATTVTTDPTGASSASFTAQADSTLLCTFTNRRLAVTPAISTAQTPPSQAVGGQLSDTATVSPPPSPPAPPGLPTPTGTVTFRLFDDDTCTGTALFTSAAVPLTNGNASVSTTAPSPPGERFWQATYDPAGDPNYLTATSGCEEEPVTVTQAHPTITTTPPAGGPAGTAISDSATVSPGASPVTGTVVFLLFAPDNPTCAESPGPVFASAPIPLEDGSAALPAATFTTTQAGTYRWVALYSGDTDNAPAQSGCQDEPVTITPATPGFQTQASGGGPLGANPPTAVFDTATVTPPVSGLVPSTGTVTFTLWGPQADPGAPVCTGTPAFAPAPVTLTGLNARSPDFVPTAAGTYEWVATYSGDANFAPAGPTACGAEPVVIGPDQPDTITTEPSGSGVAGSATPPLTDTATVTGGSSPTGTVTFELFGPQADPASPTCTGTPVFTSPAVMLSGAPPSATSPAVTPVPAQAGIYEWVATYSGDANNAANSSECGAEPVELARATPTIATTPTPSGTVTVGSTLTDAAAVTAGSGPAGPTGNVVFLLFGPDNPTCDPAGSDPLFVQDLPLTAGVAGPTSPPFPITMTGTFSWVAIYGGDGDNNAVTSPCTAEQVTVEPATPTIATTPSAAAVTVGTAISDTATLSGGFPPITGTVTFTLFAPGDTTCATPVATFAGVPLIGNTGMATSGSFTTTTVGAYHWVATFNGDGNGNNSAVTSGCTAEPVTVDPATPTIATEPLLVGATGTPIGSEIRDTATVNGGFNPSGSVTFTLFAPGDTTCATPIFTSGPIALAGNPLTATSGGFTANQLGTYRWVATFSPDTPVNVSVTSGCQAEPVTIIQATPDITTQTSPGGVVGIAISDTATVTGGFNPTGTVTFQLFAPGDTTCATPIFTSGPIMLAGAPPTATSGSFTTTAAGDHRWVATYSGDGDNTTVHTTCQDEVVTVDTATPGVSTMATPTGEVAVGGAIQDTVTVTGTAGVAAPTGVVTFQLFGPDDETCSGEPVAGPLTATLRPTSGATPPQSTATVSTTAPAARGTYTWQVAFPGDGNFGPRTLCGGADEQVAVGVLEPGDPTMATPTGPVPSGQPIQDSVTLIGEEGLPAPGGTVVFRLFGPDDPTCSREPALTTAPETLTEVTPPTSPPTSTATVHETAPGQPGTYTWEVEYIPDAASEDIFAARTTCGGDHEQVTIVQQQVSLSVIKSASPDPYTPGQPLTYTITVMNGGPDAADPATVEDPFPAQLQGASFTWTCTAAGAGTSCGAASGTAPPLRDQPVIAPSGSVTYVVTGTVPSGTSGVLRNTVTVNPPPAAEDPGCTPDCTATAETSPVPEVAPGLPSTGAQR